MKFKQLILPLILIAFAAAGLALIPRSKVSADVGEAPQPGGIIIPGDKTDKIRMTKEKVVYNVKKDDENSPFYVEGTDTGSYEKHYAHVKAEFDLKNTASSNVKMNLAFPFPCGFVPLEYFEPDNKYNPAINFAVKVDGKKINHEYVTYKMKTFSPTAQYATDDVIAIKFPVTFKAGKTTTVVTEYDARLVYEPKSIYGTFEYIMETGSHWKGTIGSGEITFNFDLDITPTAFSAFNNFFTWSKRKLTWKFTDLEPDSTHNIKITYAPVLIKVWGNRKDWLKKISASDSDELWFDWDSFPEGYGHPYYTSVEGNPIYLIAGDNPTWEDGDNGWVTEIDKTRTDWVQYDLDGTYEVSGIRIKSGILVTGYAQSGTYEGGDPIYSGDEKAFYNMFSRPKKIKLTFSDDSTKTLTLDNTPKKFVTKKFDKVQTSSLKVEILSRYQDVMEKDTYLGIARMKPVVGKKIEEAPEDEEDEQPEPPQDEDEEEPTTEKPQKTGWSEVVKNWVQQNKHILIPTAAAIVGIGIGVGVAIFILKRKLIPGG